MKYSFCESVAASGGSPWHIRELTTKGKFLTGGADTPSLCGRQMAWDLNVEVSTALREHICHKCYDALVNA